MSSWKIEGFEDIDAKLAALAELDGKADTKKVLQAGLTEAVQPMVDAAKTKAPRGETGRLQDGIKTTTRAPKNAGAGRTNAKQTRVFVVSTDQKTSWIELGTNERFHKSGKSVGKIEREPFMRPAFNEKGEEVIKRVGEVVSKAIDEAISKGGKK